MAENTSGPADAFKSRMASEMAEPGNAKLARQSLGRPLTATESEFSDAIMGIYADGYSGSEAISGQLVARDVAKPSSGKTGWSAASLEAELAKLNEELDAAYLENGHNAF